MLSFRVLGPPALERDGEPVTVDTRKAIALLAYLALTGRPQTRDVLTTLLWPENDATKARGALRRTLSVLNTALDGAGLEIDRRQLSVRRDEISIDVDDFRLLASKGDVDSLRQAIDRYRGDLLSGFGLRDSPEFEDWQLAQAEALRGEAGSVLERLTEELGDDDVDAAIAYGRRWLEIDPVAESAHRALIRLHTRKGDRAAAMRQYRECVDVLERELGIEVGAETTEAFERARAAGTVAEPDPSNLHALVGDLLTLQGRYRDAKQSFETAISLGADASAKRKLADVHQRLGDYSGAETIYEEALSAFSDRAEIARLIADRCLNAFRAGNTEQAEELAALALKEAEAVDDKVALAQARNIAGILASHRGDAAQARKHLEASLALAEEQDDPVAIAAALNNLAHVLKGQPEGVERALRLAQRALDLCVRVGDRHREAAMHSNLADLLRAADRQDEAMRHLRTSATIFAEVGAGESDELHPEIWKLVEW